jgi:hypothetical protein
MKWSLVMILMLPAAGCVSGASDAALCGGTEAARREHAAALAADGGDRAVLTGARLIRLMDAGCN